MHTVVTLFAPEVKKAAFFSEWSLHLQQGVDVGMMVNLLMEHLRTTEDAPRRAFTNLLSFMMTRSWPQFLDSIKEILEPAEISRFHEPKAEAFYNKLRLVCSLQVEDYWKQFYAEKLAEEKGLAEEVEKMPALEAKIRSIVKAQLAEELAPFMQDLVEKIKKDIKKAFDAQAQAEGDEWKKDHDDTKPEEGLET